MSSGTVNVTSETRYFAEIVVNGTSKGKREINGHPSLREFCASIAAEHGLRSFTVNYNGEFVKKAADAEQPVAAGSTVSVQAKDSRGGPDNSPTDALEMKESEPEAQTGNEEEAQSTEVEQPATSQID